MLINKNNKKGVYYVIDITKYIPFLLISIKASKDKEDLKQWLILIKSPSF